MRPAGQRGGRTRRLGQHCQLQRKCTTWAWAGEPIGVMRGYNKAAVALAGAALLISISPARRAFAADSPVSASACSVAGGRDASNNSVTCYFGMTPEQFKEATEAAAKGAATDATGQL